MTQDHPSLETLAAFAEGRLTPSERSSATDHVSQCSECYSVFAGTAAYLEDQSLQQRETSPVSTTPRWWLPIAVTVLLATSSAVYFAVSRSEGASDRLVAAANALTYRTTTGRLSGDFAWRPLPPATRSGGNSRERDPKWLRLQGAAGEILDSASDGSERHQRGVAQLLTRNEDAAIELMESGLERNSNDAKGWNDLAAAHLTRADRQDDAAEALKALTAADRALRFDPNLVAAHFNRALALEGVGLLGEALAEWRRYLAIDPSSEWSAEAREHERKLTSKSDAQVWKELQPQLASFVEKGNARGVQDAVKRFPQQARTWAEGVFLANWAEATRNGRTFEAQRQLSVAREIGQHLGDTTGELLLRDAVRAIDDGEKARDRLQIDQLVSASLLYREGRQLHHQGFPVKAEKMLREAESSFHAAGSPMAAVARYFTASALNEQSKFEACSTLLDSLDAEKLEVQGYKALAAQIRWERGLNFLFVGDHTAALDSLVHSRRIFMALGEKLLAATIDVRIADALLYVDQTSGAWKHRKPALETFFWMDLPSEVLVGLASAATHAVRSGSSEEAISLLDVGLNSGRKSNDPVMQVYMLLQRATASSQLNEFSNAEQDRNEARRLVVSIEDDRHRRRASADLALADGVAVRRRNPEESLRNFAKAKAFYREVSADLFIPSLQYEIGKSEVAAGRSELAMMSFEEGLLEVERQRRQILSVEEKAGLIATARRLSDEAVATAFDAGYIHRALEISERTRGRALLDAIEPSTTSRPMSVREIQASLAADAVVLRYLILSKRILAFAITPVSLKHHEREFGVDPTSSADSKESGSRFYRSLIAPLQGSLAGKRIAVVVADPELDHVSFDALYNPASGRFLIEDIATLRSATMTASIMLSRKATRGRGVVRALSVGATSFDSKRRGGLPYLRFLEHEARTVAALNPDSDLLIGTEATKQSVVNASHGRDLIHLGGHAVPDRLAPSQQALLLFSGDGGDDELTTRDITRMKLKESAVVVLAVCEANRSAPARDGVRGLAGAFLFAGAASVVASSQPVGDERAARFFVRLHERLRDQQDVALALRQVKIESLRDVSRETSEQLWSSVELLGGSRALVEEKGKGE
ncbi:MAG TPA: CHAT domain-containing protein [Thermoanaerobaculia bacterium]|nr:CHAT domain-containing protein [Thermoanaerobaculia bacterium]